MYMQYNAVAFFSNLYNYRLVQLSEGETPPRNVRPPCPADRMTRLGPCLGKKPANVQLLPLLTLLSPAAPLMPVDNAAQFSRRPEFSLRSLVGSHDLGLYRSRTKLLFSRKPTCLQAAAVQACFVACRFRSVHRDHKDC